MPPIWVSDVQIAGLYGSRDLSIALKQGLNVVHGRNGTGKTTLLHVLANLAGRDLERFCWLRFRAATVRMSTGSVIRLTRDPGERQSPVHLWLDGTSIGEIVPGKPCPEALRLLVREHVGGKPVYLPAFRSVLEAARRISQRSAFEDDKELIQFLEREIEEEGRNGSYHWVDPDSAERIAQKTAMCREWFGPFVPIVRTPSLLEVSRQVDQELQRATWLVAEKDREALASVFLKAFEAIVREKKEAPPSDVDKILSNLRDLLAKFGRDQGNRATGGEDVYRKLSELTHGASARTGSQAQAYDVLRVYEQALKARLRAQDDAYRQIDTFVGSVNRFLENKRLSLLAQRPVRRGPFADRQRPLLVTDDGQQHGLSVLSSGERQVVTILFAATHMSALDGMVLLDEPELSLHVDWQRIILTEMHKQAGERQIIACTHSPEVAADHSESVVSIRSKFNGSPVPSVEGDEQD